MSSAQHIEGLLWSKRIAGFPTLEDTDGQGKIRFSDTRQLRSC